MLSQNGFNISKLNTKSADLNLIIRSSKEFYAAIRQVTSQIACPVKLAFLDRRDWG